MFATIGLILFSAVYAYQHFPFNQLRGRRNRYSQVFRIGDFAEARARSEQLQQHAQYLQETYGSNMPSQETSPSNETIDQYMERQDEEDERRYRREEEQRRERGEEASEATPLRDRLRVELSLRQARLRDQAVSRRNEISQRVQQVRERLPALSNNVQGFFSRMRN